MNFILSQVLRRHSTNLKQPQQIHHFGGVVEVAEVEAEVCFEVVSETFEPCREGTLYEHVNIYNNAHANAQDNICANVHMNVCIYRNSGYFHI